VRLPRRSDPNGAPNLARQTEAGKSGEGEVHAACKMGKNEPGGARQRRIVYIREKITAGHRAPVNKQQTSISKGAFSLGNGRQRANRSAVKGISK